MKFGRYLEETLIPEWKKAYINYRGLKKIITAIKLQEEAEQPLLPSSSSAVTYDEPSSPAPTHSRPSSAGRNYGALGTTSPMLPNRPSEPPPMEVLPQRAERATGAERSDRGARAEMRNGHLAVRRATTAAVPERENINGRDRELRSSGASSRTIKSFRDRLPSLRRQLSIRSFPVPRVPAGPINLRDLLERLTPMEREFFDALDRELEKVDQFYREREQDALARIDVLKEQLKELAEHRKAFHEAHPDQGHEFYATMHALRDAMGIPHLGAATTHDGREGLHRIKTNKTAGGHRYDPEEYRQSQRKLKKAMREYYRGLELLDNYRILNLTGFRKALKKFEKVSKIPLAQQYYMDEKVKPCTFASGKTLSQLRETVELNYAARFEKGNRKLAKDKLRADAEPHSHHFSTFRAGTYLGLAIPPLVQGIARTFDPAVRAQIPAWGPLLQVYSALLIPPLFAFLVGINLIAWSRARINWVFIFELDIKSASNYKEYFEVPSFLLMTLCYAFWASFSLFGASHVPPTTWPLAWLVFALLVLLDPLPIFYAPARLWFSKTVGKLLVSGSSRVEFADFWMGDQFCSLAYSLSNLYVLGCAYENNWNDVYNTCSPANYWLPAFLSALPGLARLAQCIKRWADSGLKIHLVNAGKYASTSITYAMYFYWRHRGGMTDTSFALWILFATIGSTYTSAWDILMDWSLLRPHADHFLLREELIYSHHTYMYYFAMVTNVIGRFIWVFYIPPGSVINPSIRGFMFAIIEVLRRWQWNFYRVENEHIGNADRYRVTREIPLPYTLEEDDQKEGDVDDASTKSGASRLWGPPVVMRTFSQQTFIEGGAHGPRSARDYDRSDSVDIEEAAAVQSVSTRPGNA